MFGKDYSKKKDEKYQRLDKKAIALAVELIESGIPMGKKLEILTNVTDWYTEKGFLTEKQRVVIRHIKEDYADFEFEQALCARLTEAFNDGLTNSRSDEFVRSVVNFFNDNHRWTPLQREQIITIMNEIEGPGDKDKPE